MTYSHAYMPFGMNYFLALLLGGGNHNLIFLSLGVCAKLWKIEKHENSPNIGPSCSVMWKIQFQLESYGVFH